MEQGDSSQWHIIDTFLLVISWFSRCPIYGAFDLQFRSELGRKKSISPFRDDFYCFYFLNPRWKNINEFFFKSPGSLTCVLSCFSHVWVFATPWTVAHQAPLSMEFSRQEYWSGWPFPTPRWINRKVKKIWFLKLCLKISSFLLLLKKKKCILFIILMHNYSTVVQRFTSYKEN